MLDLNYEEDKLVTVDFNLVATEDGEYVEVQGWVKKRRSLGRNWRKC